MTAVDYEILGLKSNSDIEQVKYRYDMLMKRSLHDDSIDIDKITGAYDRIIADNTEDFFNPDAELLNEKGFNKKKIRNFIFQRKILIGILVWAFIGILLIIYVFIINPGDISLMPNMVPF